ncbi:ligand-binding sensor domain-containing protein [Acetobacterium woodii]|uniref:Two component regulator propeller n=1 Tax=Acetobacterium woodii (strain ATCC 29683 / DSM 1030 / JCM 2381 / KCTC 1655 / WB1) TaxID=931626 RepID=H6LKA1_ACEWD|nr:two-component regulator propeller domain-containing protein [Acetobacterium woodii]AFA50021.1 hypothetical protein Awo_c32930 [Acetobacterium woodii DSM 1030]
MDKGWIRMAMIVLGILIIGITLTMTVSALFKNAEAEKPKEGFHVLLPDQDICTMAYEGDTLWAGGATGIFKVNPKTLETKEIGDYRYVRSLATDNTGLWAGTDNGLVHITKEKTLIYTEAEGLPDNRILCVYPLEDGHFWLGTWGGAVEITVSEIDNGIVINTLYNSENGLLVDNVNVIHQDQRNGMWFGSYVAPRGGISVLTDGIWQYFTTGDALLHANITTIINRQDKTVVVGGGLYKYGGATVFRCENDKWTPCSRLTKASGLAGEKVRFLYEDKQGRLWVGSEYDGLTLMDNETVINLSDKTGLSQNEVKSITEDKDGNYWIGTLKGLTRIDQGTV